MDLSQEQIRDKAVQSAIRNRREGIVLVFNRGINKSLEGVRDRICGFYFGVDPTDADLQDLSGATNLRLLILSDSSDPYVPAGT